VESRKPLQRGVQVLLVQNMTSLPLAGLSPGVVNCEPEVRAATPTYCDCRNKKKPGNFNAAEITAMGYLKYHVRNEPKDGAGCPGKWLFEVVWDHFVNLNKITIKGIRGEWTFGDNWKTINSLTMNNQMTVEEAAKRTWAFDRARSKGFNGVQIIDTDGSPGHWICVDVVFVP
jgi:hypothetical protein